MYDCKMQLSMGNDLVDLEDRDSRLEAIHPRFISRVFTPEEQKKILEQRDLKEQARLFWNFWACKEAAYKALKRLHPELAFLHRKFRNKDRYIYLGKISDAPKEKKYSKLICIDLSFSSYVNRIALYLPRIHGEQKKDQHFPVKIINKLRQDILQRENGAVYIWTYKLNEYPVSREANNIPIKGESLAAELLLKKAFYQLRHQCSFAYAQEHAWKSLKYEVIKKKRIPFLAVNGYVARYIISSSHHGNYISVAIWYLRSERDLMAATELNLYHFQL